MHSNSIKEGTAVLPRKQQECYSAFYDSARKNDILESKTTLMLHLAAAMALGCAP
jgi:hypothetical protein